MEAVSAPVTVDRPSGYANAITKIAWGIALLMMIVAFATGEMDLGAAQSAPQQAAAAAMATFRMVFFYVIASAVAALLE